MTFRLSRSFVIHAIGLVLSTCWVTVSSAEVPRGAGPLRKTGPLEVVVEVLDEIKADRDLLNEIPEEHRPLVVKCLEYAAQATACSSSLLTCLGIDVLGEDQAGETVPRIDLARQMDCMVKFEICTFGLPREDSDVIKACHELLNPPKRIDGPVAATGSSGGQSSSTSGALSASGTTNRGHK